MNDPFFHVVSARKYDRLREEHERLREEMKALHALIYDANLHLGRAVGISQVLTSGPVYGIHNHKAMARALEAIDEAHKAIDALKEV